MAVLTRTPNLHAALRDVAEHAVDFFPGLRGGHPPGYAWHVGGEMPEPEQLALSELAVVRLIDLVPAQVQHEVGSEVVLTRLGAQVLSEWDAAREVSSA